MKTAEVIKQTKLIISIKNQNHLYQDLLKADKEEIVFVTLVQDLEYGQKQTPLGSLDTVLEMDSDGMRVDNLEPEAWENNLDLEVDDLDLEAEADDLDLEVDDLGQDDRDHEAKSAWEKM